MIDASSRASAARAQSAAPTMVDRPSAAEPAAHPFAEMLQQQRTPVVNAPAATHLPSPTRSPAAANQAADTGTGKGAAQAADTGSSRNARSTGNTTTGPRAGGADPAGTTGAATSSRDAVQAKSRNAASRAAAGSSDTDAAPAAAGKGGAADSDDATDKSATATVDASQIVPAVPVAGLAAATQRAPAGAPAADARAATTSADDAASTSLGAARAGASVAAGADADAAATTSASGGVASGSDRARLEPATVGNDKSASGDAGSDTKTVSSPFAAALTEAKASNTSTGAGERTTHDLSSALLATGTATPHATSGQAASSAPASATVATPVDAPDFAAAFGLQVSVLAKDGVQQAQLHLNPTDMGPVSIHITLDGTLAHVDFGADVAATRHAIEAGLPELASALRDAGFTLAGGGVAQHSASNGGGGSDDAPAGRAAAASATVGRSAVGALDATAQRRAQRAAAGGVDLFA